MRRSEPRLSEFAEWLARIGDAWEAADASSLGGLFTVGATYQPAPFDELERGRRRIVARFADLFVGWEEATFVAQVLGAGDTYGVAHYRVAARHRARDGVLVVALDARGRCESLRDWWHESGG